MSIKAARHEAARQFTISPDCISDRDFAAALATSRIITAPTGFHDSRGREQVVLVRFNPSLALGNAAGDLLALEGMAVTDDPLRESVSAHNVSVAAAVRHVTERNVSTLAVANPGIANPAWCPKLDKTQTYGLVPEQLRDLWNGDFSSISLALARAANFAIDQEGLEGLDVVRVAPSLDSSNASAGIGHMIDNGINLRRVSLIDPVGFAAVKGTKRLREFLSIDGTPYLAANHPLHQAAVETHAAWTARSLKSPANLLYGLRGVSLGGATADLENQAQTLLDNDVSLRAYVAGASEFTTLPGAEQMAAMLEARQVDVKIETIENASHAITMAAGMYARVLSDYIEQK